MLLLRVGLNAPHRPPEILILHKPSGRCGSNPAARSPSHEWPESAHLARSARPGEGHLAEPIADVQPARREPLFMPLDGHSNLLVVEACGGDRRVPRREFRRSGGNAAGAMLKWGSFARTIEQKSCTYRLVAGQGSARFSSNSSHPSCGFHG